MLRALAQHQFVPARHQHAGLAVHDPAQPVPLGVPQAAPRGGRRRRPLCREPEVASRADRPGGIQEFRAALAKLPADQREALILVGASGFSYEDAAKICGCAVGTIKSRVNRARTRLADLLAIDSVDDFGPDRATRAVLAGGGRN